MSSKSAATKTTTSNTTQTAVDRRSVLEAGQQIVDSIVYDTSSQSMRDLMDTITAQWATMVTGNSLNLHEVVGFGDKVVKMVRENQVQMSDAAFKTLETGLDEFRLLIDQGELALKIADDLANRGIDVADSATERALDVVAEVKTGDFKSLSVSVMLFALAAIFLSTQRQA